MATKLYPSNPTKIILDCGAGMCCHCKEAHACLMINVEDDWIVVCKNCINTAIDLQTTKQTIENKEAEFESLCRKNK